MYIRSFVKFDILSIYCYYVLHFIIDSSLCAAGLPCELNCLYSSIINYSNSLIDIALLNFIVVVKFKMVLYFFASYRFIHLC